MVEENYRVALGSFAGEAAGVGADPREGSWPKGHQVVLRGRGILLTGLVNREPKCKIKT